MAFDRARFAGEYDFAGRHFDIGGLDMHYVDEGPRDAETVLCLHGNPTWSFHYRNLVKSLRATKRVIVPDHIGCGLSEKPDDTRYEYVLRRRVADVEALLEYVKTAASERRPNNTSLLRPVHEGFEGGATDPQSTPAPTDPGSVRAAIQRPASMNPDRISLVAHDWGGMIAMAVAVRRPERIHRIVLMNTAAFFPPAGKRLPWRLKCIRNWRWLGEWAVLGLNAFAAGAAWMATARGMTAELREAYVSPYDSWENRIATLRFVQDIPLRAGEPSYEAVRSVQERLHVLADVPMMILWGERDFVFDRDYLSEWRRRFPKAQVHAFANAGHYVLEDERERCVELIREFVK